MNATTLSSASKSAKTTRPVRVLIVDDSAVVRQVLSRQFARDPGLEVVGTACDPYAARDKLIALRPDVMTLDVEMPKMDGISFLKKVMQFTPMPVIVLSSLTTAGSKTLLDALAAGAADVLAKPGSSCTPEALGELLIQRIKVVAQAAGQIHAPPIPAPAAPTPTPIAPVAFRGAGGGASSLFAIGASTGGVQALTEVLKMFPDNAPGTVIVQHMPPKFTASFANRLNDTCRVRVKEAANGDPVLPGHVLIAPGGYHMVLRKGGNGGSMARYHVEIQDGPEVHHQKPAVDILFSSVAKVAGPNAIGAILTGMGADGAQGLLDMRNAGAQTVAQDKDSCVVFGMPQEAIKKNAAVRIVPLSKIAPTMLDFLQAGAES